MKNLKQHFISTKLSLILMLVSVSVSAQTTKSITFPNLKDTYLKTGSFVNLENLSKVNVGVHKDQVRLLLGNPHFEEGIFNPRTWNYAFNFYTGAAGNFITCQYQLKYDEHMKVKAMYWKDCQCEQYSKGTPAVAEVPKKVTLASDGLFDFSRSTFVDLQPKGRDNLFNVAKQINDNLSQVRSVSVTGFTDRIGSQADNIALSLKRAATVKGFLVKQGVPENLIQISGMGSAHPVVSCAGSISPKVIACLAPNRRVEVQVNREN